MPSLHPAHAFAVLAALSCACAYDWTVGGGSDASAESSGDSGPTTGQCGSSCTCPAATTCNWSCSTGSCRETCAAQSTCTAACSGGGCTQVCPADATCIVSCSGGGCAQDCAAGSSCVLSCSGGGCVRTYPAGASVVQDDCPDCTCNGRMGCP